MRARVAEWHAERDGTGVCEEPGCRGAADDCRLEHVRREPRPETEEEPREPPLRWKASGVATAHDERDDRRARLRADGWVAADLVAAVCARLGADPRDLSDGRRTAPATAARAVIAHVACDGAGLTGEAVAELVGVTGVAVSLARRRGRSVLAVHGWSVDEVLSWRPAGS